MATVKDGVKVAFGFWLFFKLLGLAGCLGVVTCLVCIGKTSKTTGTNFDGESRPRRGHSAPASVRVGERVSYTKGCNLRAGPSGSSEKTGFAAAGTAYAVTERRGQWRKLTLDDGSEAWAGCAVGGRRPTSRPTAEDGTADDSDQRRLSEREQRQLLRKLIKRKVEARKVEEE